jgi:hypothetical protein
MESTWSQCLCQFQLSVTRHIFNKICFTARLFEGPGGRDPGSTRSYKKDCSAEGLFIVLSVSDHNNNNDAIFHCVVSRRMQLLN